MPSPGPNHAISYTVHNHTLEVRLVVKVATRLEPGRPRLARLPGKGAHCARLRRFEGSGSVGLVRVGWRGSSTKYPQNSVYRAAIQKRGSSNLLNSEYSRVGWVTLQSCPLFQGGKKLLHWSRKPPCCANPESESRTDSL